VLACLAAVLARGTAPGRPRPPAAA
jgi:hypothetical protein